MPAALHVPVSIIRHNVLLGFGVERGLWFVRIVARRVAALVGVRIEIESDHNISNGDSVPCRAHGLCLRSVE
jgi:hypothetical protein